MPENETTNPVSEVAEQVAESIQDVVEQTSAAATEQAVEPLATAVEATAEGMNQIWTRISEIDSRTLELQTGLQSVTEAQQRIDQTVIPSLARIEGLIAGQAVNQSGETTTEQSEVPEQTETPAAEQVNLAEENQVDQKAVRTEHPLDWLNPFN